VKMFEGVKSRTCPGVVISKVLPNDPFRSMRKRLKPRGKFRLLKRSCHRPLQEQINQRRSRLGSLYYDNITTLTTCPRRSRGCG
jgi:hypothetical protein